MSADTAKLKEVVSLLAGKNCGKCGYSNCGKFALALVEGQASPLDCRNSRDNLGAICQALGIETPQTAAAAAGSGDDSGGGREGHHGHPHHHSARTDGKDPRRDGRAGGHGGHHRGGGGHHGRGRFLSLF